MKENFVIDGKRYLSSRRASEISGYTQDYIGQLCRADKLVSKKVSKSWFVEEGSLGSYIKQDNSRCKNGDSLHEMDDRLTSAVRTHYEPLGDAIPAPVKVQTDDRSSKQKKKASPAPIIKRSVRRNKKPSLAFVGAITSFAIIVGLIFLPNINQRLGFVSEKVLEAKETAGLYEWAGNFFAQLTSLIFGGDDPDVSNAKLVQENKSQDSNRTATTGDPDQGIVVRHSDGEDQEEFNEMVNRLFSDKVVIQEDDGRSGVIKPVFENEAGDDYYYVLVPISETEDETAYEINN